MRTSFHHQSEAQPPNGPLTAATSPDTPSTCPAKQSSLLRLVASLEHDECEKDRKATAPVAGGHFGRRMYPSCRIAESISARFALILFCYSTQRHSRYNDAAVTLGLKWWRRRCQSRAARIF